MTNSEAVRFKRSPWIAFQIRPVAVFRSVNFLTGFSSAKPGVPAKLFQVSTSRLIGHSAVAFVNSFSVANATKPSCATGSVRVRCDVVVRIDGENHRLTLSACRPVAPAGLHDHSSLRSRRRSRQFCGGLEDSRDQRAMVPARAPTPPSGMPETDARTLVVLDPSETRLHQGNLSERRLGGVSSAEHIGGMATRQLGLLPSGRLVPNPDASSIQP